MTIIAFTGRKGSGKDTAAQVLVDAGAVHYKMADALKHMIAELMLIQGADRGYVRRCIEGDLKEEPSDYLNGRTPRFAMQQLGTTWGRNFMGTDFWINIFGNVAKRAMSYGKVVVCSDVRFQNEVEIIHALGGKVYRIERAGVDKSDSHESETAIDNLIVDGELVNGAPSAAEFQKQISDMFLRPLGNQPAA